MKINKERVYELMDSRMNPPNQGGDFELACDATFGQYCKDIVEALGDSEEDIIAFMEDSPEEYHYWFDEFYEELVEKFPSDTMEEEFAKFR